MVREKLIGYPRCFAGSAKHIGQKFYVLSAVGESEIVATPERCEQVAADRLPHASLDMLRAIGFGLDISPDLNLQFPASCF